MKKLFAILLCVFMMPATATETVTIVYSWTASDQAANYYRALAESANRLQKQYTFIVDYKPGAGGSVAAAHVAKTPNTILATSSAFFIRINLYPESGYNLDNYQELLPICFGPFSISSARYKNWQQVPTDQRLTIGVSGLGTTTHLTALQIQRRYPLLDVIPFKSTSEATMAALSGQTDFAVNLMGDSTQFEKANSTGSRLYVLGTGGRRSVGNKPLLIDQGFHSNMARMGSPAQLIVPVSTPTKKYEDWRRILLQAVQTDIVKQAISDDYCAPTAEMSLNPAAYYAESRSFWQRLTAGLQVE
jgi:tripartite-type tricarboxylate transporter receptor subunit TctC